MSLRNHRHAGAAALAFALSACGGGGSGGVSSLPPPPSSPSPAQTSSANPLSAAPAGVTATTSLASIGVLSSVRWNADLKAYEVQLGGDAARIAATGNAGYAEVADLIAGDGAKLPYSMQAFTGYSYTRYGYVTPTAAGKSGGDFVFGIATPAGSIPTSGSATYYADIQGHAGSWGLYGTAQFAFDFAAGTLSGHMDPHSNGPMESPTLPRYDFTATVFSPGSRSFSGAFAIDGPTPSSFQGQFTGPHAEELMASFTAPFLDWGPDGQQIVWGVMEGVMAGKKR
jgi:hypothetical protein